MTRAENSVATAQIFKSIWVSKKCSLHGSSYHLPSSSKLKWNPFLATKSAEKSQPAMLAIDVRASSFCARETRGTKAKFKTLAETFLLKAEATKTMWNSIPSWHGRDIMIDFYDCNHPFGELWRHICQTCFLFYPATSLAYAYAVVWSHFEGNFLKWHVIPIQNTTASMFLKGQLCRINFGLSQGSQKLFCAIHVPEAD